MEYFFLNNVITKDCILTAVETKYMTSESLVNKDYFNVQFISISY